MLDYKMTRKTGRRTTKRRKCMKGGTLTAPATKQDLLSLYFALYRALREHKLGSAQILKSAMTGTEGFEAEEKKQEDKALAERPHGSIGLGGGAGRAAVR
jgi:hypothetical protein